MDTNEVPHALVWFNGTQVPMNQHQYDQAVRDGALCHCKKCLSCVTHRQHFHGDFQIHKEHNT